jgi:PAS domain S-box-containing protein
MLEQRYKELVASIDGIVWEADAATLRFTFVSEQAERLLGYPLDEWFAPGFWVSHIHPDDREFAVEHCLKSTAELRTHDLEYRMIAADGRAIWIHDAVSVLVDQGRASKLRGVMLDITDRKHAEQERQAHLWFLESMDKVNRAMQGVNELDQMMSAVLETVLAILGCDRAWLLYPCNPEASSWEISMERTRPEFQGLYALASKVPMTQEIAELLRLILAARGPVRFGPGEEHQVTETSARFQVQSMMCTAVHPTGSQPYVFGVHQCSRSRVWTTEEQNFFQEASRRLADVLTSLLVFRRLSESERKRAEAERLAHVGYWERDFAAGRFTLSEEACRMLGLAPEMHTEDLDHRGRRWLEVIHPEDRKRTKRAFVAARRGNRHFDMECRVVRPDGEERDVLSRGDVLLDDRGRPTRMFGFMQDITERKRAEAQLAEVTERFRLLSDSSLTGIYLIQDGVFRYANPAAARMFGYTPEEVIDKLTPGDIVIPEDRALVAENLRQRLEGELKEIRYELRGKHKNGTVINIEVHGRRIEHGGKVGVIGTIIDITERRRAEDRLRASEARFRTFVDHATDAFFLFDAESRTFTDVNQQACDSLGYTRDELIGMTPRHIDALVAANPAYFERTLARFQDGHLVAFDSYHVRKDGSTFPVEVRLRPFRERGRMLAMALVRDITERKRAELALLESHRLLNSVIEGTTDAVYGKDVNGRYVMINSAGAQFLGKRPDEVIGKDDSQLFSPESAQKIMTTDRQVMASEQAYTSEDTYTAAGVTRTYHSTIGALHDEQGKVTGLVGISRDITDLKRMEEQFRQAQRMEAIGRLAGGIAHDFNNLLTVINGYGELALLQVEENDPNAQLLGEILNAGERASNLTRQLLAFSRKQMLDPQVVDLNALIGDILQMLRALISEQVELTFIPGPDLGLVKVDPGQFEQVVINLAVNARDAMPQGGRLAIETHNVERRKVEDASEGELRPGRYVQVAVSDSGQGMDAVTKTNIFEPFFTTKERGKGTGLGLAMVYGFLKQSGGHVEVESEPGRGSTFRIYLPWAENAQLSAKQAADIAAVPRGTETVLLVEDDEAVRKFAKSTLDTSGYTVLEARDGQDALRIAEEHEGPIHLLLTDLVMPRMGGRELTDMLTRARPETRTLLMSGYTDEVPMHSPNPETHPPLLHKPFSPALLARKVRAILDGADDRPETQ